MKNTKTQARGVSTSDVSAERAPALAADGPAANVADFMGWMGLAEDIAGDDRLVLQALAK